MRVSKKAATYSPTIVVPLALTGLTSLFGMVRGEPRRYNHLKSLLAYCANYIVDILNKKIRHNL